MVLIVKNGAARHTHDTLFRQLRGARLFVASDMRLGLRHMASALGVWFVHSGKHCEWKNAR